jgi:hypothetical protein
MASELLKRRGMKSVALLLALSACSFALVAGCAEPTSSDEEEAAAASEDELKSSECPPAIDVLLLAPTVMTDAKLKSTWSRDMASYESDPDKAAAEQLTELSSHLSEARSQKAVKLHGTRGAACFYKTVDAQTGKPNGYRVWFAKVKQYQRPTELQLRIERDLGDPDALFFNIPVKTLKPTAVEVDSSKDGRVYAQRHEEGYHGEPEGPNAWIGYVKATATLSQ